MGHTVERGDVGVPHDAGDFFDEVDFAFDVEAVRGDAGEEAVVGFAGLIVDPWSETKGGEDGKGAFRCDGDADDLLKAGEAHGDGLGGFGGGGAEGDGALGEV